MAKLLPFREQISAWKKMAWRNTSLSFQDGHLELGFCSDCRLCCGPQPQGPPVEMKLLLEQVRAGAGAFLKMADEETAILDTEGCAGLRHDGCVLSSHVRPVCCAIYPFSLIRGSLYLSLLCPAAYCVPLLTWYELTAEVAGWLRTLSEQELRRIALRYPASIVSDCFLSLRWILFVDTGFGRS